MSKPAHSIDRILSWATLHPWALEPRMLQTVAAILARRALDGPRTFDPTELAALRADTPHPSPLVADAVSVIPVHGVIAPRMTALHDISGGTTFEGLTRAVQEARDDPRVSTIVLDIDSPGGSVLGARVFARALLQARTVKPVVAQIEYSGHSAAYWAAACATEVVASPGALLGSIGVFMVHDDISRLLDAEGVTRTLIAKGDHKLDGNEAQPLTASAKARYESIVAESYAHFLGDVAAGRGVTADQVRKEFGQGGVVTVAEGLACGMVDREATLADTLARLGVSASPTSIDTPQEPAKATGQDRELRALTMAFQSRAFTVHGGERTW